jgi:hypothetical protein
MLIITYTSSHNHPGPDVSTTNLIQPPKEPQSNSSTEDLPTPTKAEQQELAEEEEEDEEDEEEEEEEEKQNDPIVSSSEKKPGEDHDFHYIQSPISGCLDITVNQGEDPFTVHLEKTHETMGLLLDEEPLCYSQLMNFSTPFSEENDFFDELEELPTSSSLTSFMRSNFSDERIPVVPS